MVVVVRRADQRDRLAEAQLSADVARRARAAIEIVQIEQRRRFTADHAETCRRFLQQGPDQRGAECRIVPGGEPTIDAVDGKTHAGHAVLHRLDRPARIFVGVLDSREALFFVVDNQARAARAGDLDQRDARIVDAGRRYAGEIGGFAALDLRADRADARAREGAGGAKNAPPAVEAFEQRQGEAKAGRAEPWVAWPNPHAAASPVGISQSTIHRIRRGGWQPPARNGLLEAAEP